MTYTRLYNFISPALNAQPDPTNGRWRGGQGSWPPQGFQTFLEDQVHFKDKILYSMCCPYKFGSFFLSPSSFRLFTEVCPPYFFTHFSQKFLSLLSFGTQILEFFFSEHKYTSLLKRFIISDRTDFTSL